MFFFIFSSSFVTVSRLLGFQWGSLISPAVYAARGGRFDFPSSCFRESCLFCFPSLSWASGFLFSLLLKRILFSEFVAGCEELYLRSCLLYVYISVCVYICKWAVKDLVFR